MTTVIKHEWENITAHCDGGRYVNAIKQWRTLTGDNLRDSKAVIDAYRNDGTVPDCVGDGSYGVPLPVLQRPVRLITLLTLQSEESCVATVSRITDEAGDISCEEVSCSDCIFKRAARNEKEKMEMLHDLILKGDIIV